MHVVLNNGSSGDSVGGQPTVAQKINIPQIAKNCGYKNVAIVKDNLQLIEKIKKYKSFNEGPNLIEVMVCKVREKT